MARFAAAATARRDTIMQPRSSRWLARCSGHADPRRSRTSPWRPAVTFDTPRIAKLQATPLVLPDATAPMLRRRIQIHDLPVGRWQ